MFETNHWDRGWYWLKQLLVYPSRAGVPAKHIKANACSALFSDVRLDFTAIFALEGSCNVLNLSTRIKRSLANIFRNWPAKQEHEDANEKQRPLDWTITHCFEISMHDMSFVNVDGHTFIYYYYYFFLITFNYIYEHIWTFEQAQRQAPVPNESV